MYALRALMKYPQLCRNISASRNIRDMAKFKELQRQMQVDDGVPVHLKKGTPDKLLFGFVLLASAYVGAECIGVVYKLIYPPPNK